MRTGIIIAIILVCFGFVTNVSAAKQTRKSFEEQVVQWEQERIPEIVAAFDQMVADGVVTKEQLNGNNLFYWPDKSIKTVEKWHTVFESGMKKYVQPVQDKYLAKHPKLVYFAIMDRNCYAPTHNSRFDAPISGDPVKDMKFSRSRRFFVDPVGLRAARNTGACIAQKYPRNTGEFLLDVSCPFSYDGVHWGAVRAGFSVLITEQGKEEVK